MGAPFPPYNCNVTGLCEYHIMQERIKTVDRAAEQVDLAVSEALRRRRPVLIEVCQPPHPARTCCNHREAPWLIESHGS